MESNRRWVIASVCFALVGLSYIPGREATSDPDGLVLCHINGSAHHPNGTNFTCTTDCCSSNEAFCCEGEECCTDKGITKNILSSGQVIAIAVAATFLVVFALGVLVCCKVRSYRPRQARRNVREWDDNDLVPEHAGYDQPGTSRGSSRY